MTPKLTLYAFIQGTAFSGAFSCLPPPTCLSAPKGSHTVWGKKRQPGECHRHCSLRPGGRERSVLARASIDLRKRFKREKGRHNRRGKRWAQRGRRVDRPPCVPRAALSVPLSVIHIRTMGRIEQKKKKMHGSQEGLDPCAAETAQERESPQR